MQLRVTRTTDNRHIGLVIETPADEFGQLTQAEIDELARNFFDGQFTPSAIAYSPPNQVRLINSNYSLTLERIDG